MYRFNFKLRTAEELNDDRVLKYLEFNLIHCETENLINIANPIVESVEQIDWFIENENLILSAEVPFSLEECESVAVGMKEIYDKIDLDDEELLDRISEFRFSHAIRMAFRGQDLPDIFIAKGNNNYEVSCSEDNIEFCYQVEIVSLFEEIKSIKADYINQIV